ncbi:DUF2079 domain-containing protein [Streptomyces sp. M19]
MDTAATATTGSTAASTRLRDRAAALRAPGADPYWLALALFAAFTVLSVGRYRHMASMSWDLGIFEQAIRAYAHLEKPVADLKGPAPTSSATTSARSPRWPPLLPGLPPRHAAGAPGRAVRRVRRAGHPRRRRTARPRPGLAIGVAYGLSWAVQRAVDFDFHEIAFAMPLLAFSLEAVIRRRWYTAMAWAVPLAFVKEDMGATVAAIGLVIMIRDRRRQGATRSPVTPFALGLIGFGCWPRHSPSA